MPQVTINGEAVLNATLQRIQELLDEELPVRLEVGQPVLKEPIYIREATREPRVERAPDRFFDTLGFSTRKRENESTPGASTI